MRDREVGAQHVERAVREIDDARDAEHDRQSGGDDEQRGRAGQPVQRLHEEEGEIGHAIALASDPSSPGCRGGEGSE